MSKLILPSLFTIFVFVVCASVVFAADNPATTSGRMKQDFLNLKQDIKNTRQVQQAEIQKLKSAREELSKKLEQQKTELKDKRYEKVVARIGKIITARRQMLERLDSIASKIQTRIDKLKAAGVDVSAMQAALDSCATVKSNAATSIADSESTISTIDFNSPNAKSIAQAQVSAIHQSNDALKSYHSCLVSVISKAPKSTQKGATGSAQ